MMRSWMLSNTSPNDLLVSLRLVSREEILPVKFKQKLLLSVYEFFRHLAISMTCTYIHYATFCKIPFPMRSMHPAPMKGRHARCILLSNKANASDISRAIFQRWSSIESHLTVLDKLRVTILREKDANVHDIADRGDLLKQRSGVFWNK